MTRRPTVWRVAKSVTSIGNARVPWRRRTSTRSRTTSSYPGSSSTQPSAVTAKTLSGKSVRLSWDFEFVYHWSSFKSKVINSFCILSIIGGLNNKTDKSFLMHLLGIVNTHKWWLNELSNILNPLSNYYSLLKQNNKMYGLVFEVIDIIYHLSLGFYRVLFYFV